MAVKYELKEEMEPSDLKLLKEYAAEQFILFDCYELIAGRTTPYQGGIFGVAVDAADYYSGPNYYDIEGNHLRSEQELSDADSIQIGPISL